MLTLEQMFDMQKELDAKIVREKGLEDYDRLPDLILALQVELGETANEWRGFKYWSIDKQSRNYCLQCRLSELPHECKNPLLEEYVDCLHFILSIGIVCGFGKMFKRELWNPSIAHGPRPLFASTFEAITRFDSYYIKTQNNYELIFNRFAGLGECLGFTFDQIAEAYAKKNAVNHDRQANGY